MVGAAHRCLPAAAGSGRKARRSSAPALWESPHLPLRCPPMAELFCSEGLTTMEAIGAAWTFAQRAGHWVQEKKLVGSGEARKAASFTATSSEDGVMGRANEERMGPAAASRPDGGGSAQEPLLFPQRIHSLHVEE